MVYIIFRLIFSNSLSLSLSLLSYYSGVNVIYSLVCSDHKMVRRAACEVFCNMATHPTVLKVRTLQISYHWLYFLINIFSSIFLFCSYFSFSYNFVLLMLFSDSISFYRFFNLIFVFYEFSEILFVYLFGRRSNLFY